MNLRTVLSRISVAGSIVTMLLVYSIAFVSPAITLQAQQQPLYRSCTEDRGSKESPAAAALKATPAATTAATAAATAAATPAATAAASANTAANLVFFRIAGKESEACYQVGEIFADGNVFNLAIGVTKSIDGEVAIDMNNLANSKIGDIVINISEFQSDEARRDGMIRRQWLESNKFPLVKLTNARVEGLPAGAYKPGDALKFKVIGDLELRGKKKEITFNATAALKENILVVTAVTDIKMSDYGVEPPNIVGMLKADNAARLVLNLVARPAA